MMYASLSVYAIPAVNVADRGISCLTLHFPPQVILFHHSGYEVHISLPPQLVWLDRRADVSRSRPPHAGAPRRIRAARIYEVHPYIRPWKH